MDFKQTGLLKSCTSSLSVSVHGLQTDRTAQVLYPIVVGFSPRTSNRPDCSSPVPHRCRFQSTDFKQTRLLNSCTSSLWTLKPELVHFTQTSISLVFLCLFVLVFLLPLFLTATDTLIHSVIFSVMLLAQTKRVGRRAHK